MLISAYDYWGYYNICFFGGEVRDPQGSIPRAILGSIAIIGALYLMMNISVLGIVPGAYRGWVLPLPGRSSQIREPYLSSDGAGWFAQRSMIIYLAAV
jgi:amino acid transporter